MIQASVISQNQVIFQGIATSVILPGDYGEFEIMQFHWPILSILIKGEIIIDNMGFPISKGIARFGEGKLVALVEL